MEKISSIYIFLFGKPEWEFNGEFNPQKIREKGDELKTRLYEIADNLEKLSKNGWDYQLALYDIILDKNISKTAAKKELAKLGIKEEIQECEDED